MTKLSARRVAVPKQRLVLTAAILAAAILPIGTAARAAEQPAIASPWITEQASRSRVIAGAVKHPTDGARIYAGLEIELEDGWKTYWRNPGSSGVPPRVDLDGSENLAKAELLFPAPLRFKDREGDTIGYKKSVILPVALTPKDPARPIVLKVAAEFGICREVCIPVQPNLTLTVPADAARALVGGPLPDAVGRVPTANAAHPDAPRLERVTATLTSAKPQIVIDAAFPGDAERGDVFLEAPDGIWIPLPQPAGRSDTGARRFVVDLTDGADLDDLKGRAIRMTLVGSAGQSEASFDLVEAR